MEWKTLHKVSKRATKINIGLTIGLFLISNIWTGAQYEFRPQPDGSFVSIDYLERKDGSNTLGFYSLVWDDIKIFYEPGEHVLKTLVHELKHSNNAQQFSYVINTDANEISACLASDIYTLGCGQRVARIKFVRDSIAGTLPYPDYVSPIHKLAHKRLRNNKDWVRATKTQDDETRKECDSILSQTVQQLRTERARLIDSIAVRFDGAVRDSLIRDVKNKYDEDSAADKILGEYNKKIINVVSEATQIDKPAFARDFDYSIIELNQNQVDSLFIRAMKHWRNMRPLYTGTRLASILYTQVHPLNDTELEKLFTYKINGVHRSLFKEASPEIQKQVRQMANADNLMFRLKNAMGRE